MRSRYSNGRISRWKSLIETIYRDFHLAVLPRHHGTIDRYAELAAQSFHCGRSGPKPTFGELTEMFD